MIQTGGKRAVATAALLTTMIGSIAVAATTPDAQKTERCATRLSIALLGLSPDAALLSATSPADSVDQMLATSQFEERFSRFVNATFNGDPGSTPEQDSAYYLAKYVLANNKPWEEMFIGQYNVDLDANKVVQVTADPNGLGYFRSMPWLKRYAGNELAGIKISTAYRMMHNTVGLKLIASTNAPGADISATGRQATACRGCHYDSWFALDKTASVLSKRVGNGDAMTFAAPTVGPQMLLGGISVSDDKGLVTALVKSEPFRFRSCRLAFEFLYGRAEQTCEGPIFDACMQAFSADGNIRTAISVVAKSAAYCQ